VFSLLSGGAKGRTLAFSSVAFFEGLLFTCASGSKAANALAAADLLTFFVFLRLTAVLRFFRSCGDSAARSTPSLDKFFRARGVSRLSDLELALLGRSVSSTLPLPDPVNKAILDLEFSL